SVGDGPELNSRRTEEDVARLPFFCFFRKEWNMRRFGQGLTVLMTGGMLFVACDSSAADETKGPDRDIERLINLLGSPHFKEREQATRELSKFGMSALPGLKAAGKSREAEVRRRALQLVEQIEGPVKSTYPVQRIPSAKIYL